MGRFRNPYTRREMVEILLLAWGLLVFIMGGFLILTAMANSMHFCGDRLCPWPFDTYAGNFVHRALLVLVLAVPGAFAILFAGMMYYGRRGRSVESR